LKGLKDQQMIVKVVKRGEKQRREKGLKPADLKIYISMNNREPGEHNCERLITDVIMNQPILTYLETDFYF
jgi:hypothetical protein